MTIIDEIVKSKEYDAVIKGIKQKRTAVIVITTFVVLITLVVCTPIQLEVSGEKIVNYKGISPVINVGLVLLILFLEAIFYALVSAPLNTSLDVECNPEKYLILNHALNKQKNKNHIYAAGLIGMGRYELALEYANNMINSKQPSMVLAGLFNKARCEFFLNDFIALKNTLNQFEAVLKGMGKINENTKNPYIKIKNIMHLLVAIADKDNQKMLEYRSVEAWNGSNATKGYVNFLKGLTAYNLGDKQEAIYKLKYVVENCQKTAFSQLAEKYIAELI